jgi:hypothetical protein
MSEPTPVHPDLILQVLGANVVEVVALRIKVAQLEQQLQQMTHGSNGTAPVRLEDLMAPVRLEDMIPTTPD